MNLLYPRELSILIASVGFERIFKGTSSTFICGLSPIMNNNSVMFKKIDCVANCIIELIFLSLVLMLQLNIMFLFLIFSDTKAAPCKLEILGIPKTESVTWMWFA